MGTWPGVRRLTGGSAVRISGTLILSGEVRRQCVSVVGQSWGECQCGGLHLLRGPENGAQTGAQLRSRLVTVIPVIGDAVRANWLTASSKPAKYTCTLSNSPEYLVDKGVNAPPEHQTAGRPLIVLDNGSSNHNCPTGFGLLFPCPRPHLQRRPRANRSRTA